MLQKDLARLSSMLASGDRKRASVKFEITPSAITRILSGEITSKKAYKVIKYLITSVDRRAKTESDISKNINSLSIRQVVTI